MEWWFYKCLLSDWKCFENRTHLILWSLWSKSLLSDLKSFLNNQINQLLVDFFFFYQFMVYKSMDGRCCDEISKFLCISNIDLHFPLCPSLMWFWITSGWTGNPASHRNSAWNEPPSSICIFWDCPHIGIWMGQEMECLEIMMNISVSPSGSGAWKSWVYGLVACPEGRKEHAGLADSLCFPYSFKYFL